MGLRQNIRDLHRFKKVISVLLKHDFGFLIKRVKLHRDLSLKQRLNRKSFEPQTYRPKQFRLALEELGGAFIKLGQILSLRPDLIPTNYCKEFEKLQDHAPSFEIEKAIEIIESELNKPIEKIFRSFSREPMAAASIAQVHEAVLTSGRKVVVKVQRPNVKEKIHEDLDILKYIAKSFEKYHKLEFLNIPAIIEEIERFSKDELDFRKEAKNIDLFYKYNLAERDIIVPRAHLNHTTSKVLVMDFIEGKELKNIVPPNKTISRKIVNSIMKQVFVDGFFHGDPHPGNILVKGKKIAFIDFGIMGRLDKDLKKNLFKLFAAAINRNGEKLAEALLSMNTKKGVPKEKLMEDLSLNFREYYKMHVKDIDFDKVYNKIFEFARKDDILLPVDFVLFGKTFVTLESVAKKYDPTFDIVRAAKPFIKKMIANEISPSQTLSNLKNTVIQFKDFFKGIPKGSKKFIEQLQNTDEDLRKIDQDFKTMTMEMDRSSNRITYGVILASVLIASALLIKEKTYTIFDISLFSFIGFVIAGIIVIAIFISVLKEKKFRKGDIK